MTQFVVAVYSEYDTIVVGTDKAGMEQADGFLAVPVGGELIVKFVKS